MKVKLAKTAGFCMGVKRAMNIVLDAANKKDGQLYTYGPLVHNPQAVEMLKQKGVEILGDRPVSNATVILRAHGVAPEERRKLKDSGNLLCDATCPHVARAQAIVKKEVREGAVAIIIGDKGHAEVNGILGCAGEKGFVVETSEDVNGLPPIDSAIVVAQTTQDRKVFNEILQKIKSRIADVKIYDTICDSTNMRQQEVKELAREVDAMVIVGGKNSANTKRLYEISCSTGVPSFHIEEEEELDNLGLERYENIGVMAGASTPNWVIIKVIDRIKYLLKKQKSPFFRFLESLGEFFVESTLYLALGAVSMCYASLVIQGIKPSATILSMAFLYVFVVHVFNRYHERLKDEFSDPARTRFFKDYGKLLIGMAIVASVTALYLSYLLGPVPFLFLLFSYFMGMIYGLTIVPKRVQSFIKYRRIKDFPGSRDILASLAWAWVIVMIPFFSHRTTDYFNFFVILSFVVSTVFIRSVVFDLISIEGDRIVGRETIPLLFGQKRTELILFTLTLIVASLMMLSAYAGLVPSLAYYLIVPPVLMIGCLYIFQKQRLQVSKWFEALIDSSFIFSGVITYMWQIMQM